MTPCIQLGTTHPCNPPHYGVWVNLHFFMCIYKHCFLPMLLVFAMKCCTKIPFPLPHNHYCCLLPSPVCLPHLLICTCLISSPIACPPLSVLCWCLLLFFFQYFWYMLHLFVTPFWIVCVYYCMYAIIQMLIENIFNMLLAPAHNIFILLATFLAWLCTTVTCQPIELESCWKPSKDTGCLLVWVFF